jgi:hypothetical protein
VGLFGRGRGSGGKTEGRQCNENERGREKIENLRRRRPEKGNKSTNSKTKRKEKIQERLQTCTKIVRKRRRQRNGTGNNKF